MCECFSFQYLQSAWHTHTHTRVCVCVFSHVCAGMTRMESSSLIPEDRKERERDCSRVIPHSVFVLSSRCLSYSLLMALYSHKCDEDGATKNAVVIRNIALLALLRFAFGYRVTRCVHARRTHRGRVGSNSELYRRTRERSLRRSRLTPTRPAAAGC